MGIWGMRLRRLGDGSRALFCILLCAVLVLGAWANGIAHGAPQAAGSRVICAGAETITVWVDRAGHPVERLLPCPDCTLCLGDGMLPGSETERQFIPRLRRAVDFVERRVLPHSSTTTHHARAPPPRVVAKPT